MHIYCTKKEGFDMHKTNTYNNRTKHVDINVR